MTSFVRKMLIFSAALAGLLVVQSLPAQERRMVREIPGQGAFNLPELGAVVIEKDSVLSFLHVMPPDQRPKAFKDVDIQPDDILVMANGKRMYTADQLTTLHEKLAIGDEMKFGIKRGNEMRLVSLTKADPADLPRMKMVMKTDGGPEPAGGQGKRVISMGGGGEDLMILGKLGLVAAGDGKDLTVARLLPEASDIYSDKLPQEGDVLLALGSVALDSPETLDTELAKLTAGTVEALSVRRGEETLTFKFTCPKSTPMSGNWKTE